MGRAENVIQVLNATKDNEIEDGSGSCSQCFSWNFGASIYLDVGVDNFGVGRTLVSFDLNQLQPSNLSLEKATLQLVFRSTFFSPTLCVDSSQLIGCPTAHLLSKDFGEGEALCNPGQQCGRSAFSGESSWNHNSFPEDWTSPGGDFETDPVGKMLPPQSYPRNLAGTDVFQFTLDVTRMEQMINNPSRFYGFILRDDRNNGLHEFYSRECLESSSCGGVARTTPPQLVLEFTTSSDPTSAPSNADPSQAPTAQLMPSLIPTTPASIADQVSICQNYVQDMRLTISASVVQLNTYRNTLENQLEVLTVDCLSFVAVTTSANVRDFLQSSDEESNIVIETRYELCFEMLSSAPGSELIDTFPSEFVVCMSISRNRNGFEDRLQEAGIPIVGGSLSAARTLAEEEQSTSPDNTGVIIGGSMGGSLLLLGLLVGWTWMSRRKRRLSQLNSDSFQQQEEFRGEGRSTNPTPVPVAFALPHAPVARLSRKPQVQNEASPTPNNPPINLGYKEQGQSVTAEQSVQENFVNPKPYDSASDDASLDV